MSLTNSAPKQKGGITALGIGQLVSWGTLYYSFPLIAEAMVNDLGWSRADLYGAATLGLLISTLAVCPIGALIDHGKGRFILVGATLAASLALIAWSFVETLVTFYCIVITVGILQAAVSYEPAFAVAVQQLKTQSSRSAITTITLWAGFASTVFVPLLHFMIDELGWRGALLGLAVINTAIAGPLYLWATRATSAAKQPINEASKHKEHVKPILYSLRFYLLTASFCVYMALFSGFTYHIYPLLSALTTDTQTVLFAIALIGPAQVGGRVLLLLFEDVSIKHLGLLAGVSFPLAILMLKAPPSVFTFASLCVLYGAANGIFTIVRGMAVPELLTQHNYGTINGIMLIPMSLARAAAPWAIAAYWTYSGAPSGALNVLLALAILIPVLFGLAICTKHSHHTH